MGAASEAAPRLPDGQGVPKVRKSDKMAIVRKKLCKSKPRLRPGGQMGVCQSVLGCDRLLRFGWAPSQLEQPDQRVLRYTEFDYIY